MSGAGIGKLKQRLHDLLDDALNIMNVQKTDKVTPLDTPVIKKKDRSKSAAPIR